MTLTPTRTAALQRLEAFQPDMGVRYAQKRNYDFGPGCPDCVSMLSAYVRHRVLSERELVSAVVRQ